jgi:hypothetical protein
VSKGSSWGWGGGEGGDGIFEREVLGRWVSLVISCGDLSTQGWTCWIVLVCGSFFLVCRGGPGVHEGC